MAGWGWGVGEQNKRQKLTNKTKSYNALREKKARRSLSQCLFVWRASEAPGKSDPETAQRNLANTVVRTPTRHRQGINGQPFTRSGVMAADRKSQPDQREQVGESARCSTSQSDRLSGN